MSETKPKPVDYHSMMTREVYGHDPRSRWWLLEVLGDPMVKRPRAETYFRIKTGVCLATYAKGPAKGQLNWKRRLKDMDREEIISFAAFDAFIAKKKAETQAAPVAEPSPAGQLDLVPR